MTPSRMPSVRADEDARRAPPMVTRPARALVLALGLVLALAGAASACGDGPDPDAPSDDASAPDDASSDVVHDGGTEDRVVPRGARTLGIQVDLGDVALLRRVQAAKAAHASTTTVSFAWDEVEIPYDGGVDAPDAAATALYQPALHIANLVLSSESVGMVLSLDAFDGSGSRAPADLRGAALDDDAVLARYDALESYAFSQLGDVRVDTLLIASDAERLPSGADTAAAFARFVAHVRDRTRELAPSVTVGFALSARGAKDAAEKLADAWAASDVVALDWTAVDDATRAIDPASLPASLADALTALPDKPVLLRALGYPSAPEVGGSPERQARFVTEAFAAWDQQAARIPLLVFRELDDAPEAVVVERAKRQGRNDEAFRRLVGSLGLRDVGGSPKPAYDEVARQASARGF